MGSLAGDVLATAGGSYLQLVSIPIYGGGSAPPSLGLNASQLKLLAEYESIKQQSLMAVLKSACSTLVAM